MATTGRGTLGAFAAFEQPFREIGAVPQLRGHLWLQWGRLRRGGRSRPGCRRGGRGCGLEELAQLAANLPCQAFDANAAWLEIVLAATDLVTWTRIIGFTDHPRLARTEIATLRYRVLHVAARITRGARQTRLRIDATWRWAPAIATAWHTIRTAFR